MGFNGNIVCLVVDRLHVGYLGAYGNTWIQTPALDRLAAESFLFDRAILDSPELKAVYRSYWDGWHAAVPDAKRGTGSSLPAQFAAAGWKTLLVTDDADVAGFPGNEAFAECQIIRSDESKFQSASPRVADELEETDAAAFFATAGEALKNLKGRSLLWLHTGTLGRLWDAPLEFRAQYSDEEDPEPGDWARVPSELLPPNVDPDKLLGITHAYAGQISFIDQSIESLLENLDESSKEHETLFVLISARGFPLGEHRQVGPGEGGHGRDALYSELIHIPWLMHLPNHLGRAARTQRIVQPPDLPATLSDFAGLSHRNDYPPTVGRGRSLLPLVRSGQAEQFDRAYCVSALNERAFVTPRWSLLSASPEEEHLVGSATDTAHESRYELFVKPDDWFDVNEVSNRCPDIVEAMVTAMNEYDKACQSADGIALSQLPSELVD